jgi:hypothetical protein
MNDLLIETANLPHQTRFAKHQIDYLNKDRIMNKLNKRSLGLLALCISLVAFMPDIAQAQKKAGGSGLGNKQAPAQKSVGKGAPGGREATDRKVAPNSSSNNGNRNASGDKRIGNQNNVGNKVNVDNSRKNVNVNVDNSKNIKVNNSHNTRVRHTSNYRPYSRPPYRYGGYRYNCYHPYFYHPYRPFYWGPMWHPWGFFVATLATTAIIVSFADNDLPDYPLAMASSQYDGTAYASLSPVGVFGPNASWDFGQPGGIQEPNAGDEYYYDAGVFYLKGNSGYTVVAAPVGAIVTKLPEGVETVKLDDGSTNYYFGGTFYEKNAKGYVVVPPTAGTVIEHLPDGGEEVDLGGTKYVKFGEVYFQPIQQDGKDVYEIASVEEDK